MWSLNPACLKTEKHGLGMDPRLPYIGFDKYSQVFVDPNLVLALVEVLIVVSTCYISFGSMYQICIAIYNK